MAKVVFCQRVYYSLFGYMSMAGLLKENGHSVKAEIDADPKRAAAKVLRQKPDIVGFSVLVATGEFEWALATAALIKKSHPEVFIIFGNLFPTIFPEEAIARESVDAICLGEGEYPLLELCSRKDDKSDIKTIPGLWVREGNGSISRNAIAPLIKDLDKLPYPDRNIYDGYSYFSSLFSLDVLMSRNCEYSCSYCFNHVLKKKYTGENMIARHHSVDYVIGELTGLKKKYSLRYITFVDELFVRDKSWLKEFAHKYKAEINLPFICNVRADIVDEERAALLKSAGADRVCFGIESGVEESRFSLLNKKIKDDQIIRCAEILHKNGIKFLTANMLGLPGESIESDMATAQLNIKIKADYPYATLFQPYPGLKITDEAIKKNLISKSDTKNCCPTFFRDSVIKQEKIKEIIRLHKLFFFLVKMPFLKAIVKLLVKLPLDFVYDYIFMLSYAIIMLRCFRRHPKQLLLMGIENMKVYFSGHSSESGCASKASKEFAA